jgi:hypothetical protein
MPRICGKQNMHTNCQTERLKGKNNLVGLEYRCNDLLRNTCELDSPASEQRRQISRVHKATKFLVQLNNFQPLRKNHVTRIFVHHVTKYSAILIRLQVQILDKAQVAIRNSFASTNARLKIFVSTNVLK